MKKVKIILKSLLVVLMTVLMSLTSLSSSSSVISAGNATEGYDVDIYHGIGRGPSYSPTAGKVFTGMSLIGEFNDNGYKYSGKTAPGGYSNGPASGETNNKYYQKPQGDIKSVDFYYEDQMINIKSVVSGTTNCVKAAVYLKDGELQAVNTASAGPSSFPAGSTKLVIFQAAGTGDEKDMATRWYNVPGDIKMVFHYKNEYKVTVSNVADTSIDEDFDTYFVDKTVDNKTVTTISKNYSSEEGLVMKVTPRNATITSVVFTTNENVVLDNFSGVMYLNSANVFTSTHTESDILSYNPTTKEITFYNISRDLGVSFNYSVNVTLNPNNGVFADETTTPIVQNGANAVAVDLPVGLTRTSEGGKSFEFDGWYTSASDFSSANKVSDGDIFGENTTLYAGWKETYKITFNPGIGELNETSDYSYTDIVTSTLGSSAIKTVKNEIIADGTDENILNHFIGWYDNNVGLYTSEHEVNTAYVFNSDTTVYAIFEHNYKITFDINGGQFSDLTTDDKFLYTDTISYDGRLASSYAVKESVVINDETYYALNAWFTSPSNFTEEYRINGSTVFEGDTTVYAGWTLEKETVNFYVDGSLYASKVTGKGLSINAPEQPTKEGFTFLGWFIDEGTFENEYDFSSIVNSDLQLHALFKQTVNVSVVGALSASGAAVTPTNVIRFDEETSTAMISKGTNTGTKLVVRFDYGSVDRILINNVGFAASELIGNAHKSVYIDANGVKQTSSGASDMMKIDFRKNTKYLTLNLLTINEDVTFEFVYKDVTLTFYNGGSLYAQRVIPFNTETDITSVEDPYLEGYTFFGWFTDDETFENEFSLEGIKLLSDTSVYANLSKDFYLNVYYGYGREHGTTHTLEAVFTGAGAMLNNNTGYSIKGSRNIAFSLQGNTAMDYRYDKPWQTEIDYLEIYYNGSSVRVDHQISALNNSVIKQDIYLTPEGQLTINPDGNLPMAKLASSTDAANGSVATRWYEIPGAIDMVFHYYDEHVVTVKNIASSTVSEDYDKYFVSVDTSNKLSETIISGNYAGTGIAMNVTPSESDVDNIKVSVGDKVSTIEHSQINKTLYLNANYEFVTTRSEDDFLQYKNNSFTYYRVESDIEIEYAYQHTITLNADKGTLSSGASVVKTINGRITAPSLVSEHVVIDETDWYFAGWFDSENKYVDFDEVITKDDTFTALWSNVPINIISVKNAFNVGALDPITTANAADYILFKGDSSLAELASTKTATMNVHAEHGVLNSITFKLSNSVTTTLENLDLAGVHYITGDGSIVDSAVAGYKLSVEQVSPTNYLLTFANLDNDLIITLNYEELSFAYLLEDDSVVATTYVPFNTAPEQITDPEIEGYWFDGWYSDKAFTTPYDFSEKIIDNTNVYAKLTVKHTLRYINTSSFTGTPISSEEWASRVGDGLFDGEHSIAYTRNNFNSEAGVKTIFNAALGNVKSVTFAYGDKVVKFPDAELEAELISDAADSILFKRVSAGYFLMADGTVQNASSTITSDVVAKFVHDKDTNYDYGTFSSSDSGGRYYNLRYYNINEDITVTIEYEDVNVTYIDENDAALVFNVDTKTANTVVSEDGRSFSVPAYDLQGDEAHSIRIAIDPNLAKIKGVRFSSPSNPSRYEDFYFVGNGSVDTALLSEFGKIKAAYSVASSAVDGILYFRFLNLYESVVITPILYAEQAHTVIVETAEGLSISNDEAPEGIVVSEDNKTITVPYGKLWKYTTASELGSSSFRWNLGPTAGFNLEYSKLEVIDKETGSLLATIGEDFESYTVNNADQTRTVMNTPNGLFIRYNKAPDSTAQIRIWAVNKDVILKVYYKDFVNEGTDIPYDEADFTPYQVKVTLKQTEEDAKKSDSKFSYKTVSSVVTNGTVEEGGVKYITKSITSSSADLTGNNVEITKDKDIIVSNIIRLSLVDNSKYTVSKVTMTVEGHAPIVLEANDTVKDTEFGQFVYVMNGNDTHIRFNRIFTDKEIFVSVEYKSMGDGPYKGVLTADKRLNVTLDSSTPNTVTASKDKKTITVPEGALREGVNGKSAYWYLSSTAGMQYEYSRIEVSFYNKTTKKYDVVASLGDNFQSYKNYKNGEGDQTAGKQLQGLYVRYNKSHYGEAQIRVWNVYQNFKITVYYKDYETGKEYAANNSNLDFTYDGTVTLKGTKTLDIETDIAKKAPITKINGDYQIRFDKFASEDYGIKYIVKPTVLGDNVDTITVTVDGKSYEMGEGVLQYKATGKVFPGARVRFARTTDGSVQLRVWALTDDIEIEFHVSHNHKYTVSFDVGEHGTATIADIPASARVQDKDFKKIVVWQGSTNNSKAGNKTSIRYDVTPKFGYDIDYILFTTKGETYKIDNKELPNGKTLTTKAVDGASVRYNVDSNGIAQIRVVHVDANCSVKVFYREITHKVIINTRKLAIMRAEGYNLGARSEFSPNYAVTYVPGGATYARQNGIKYWLQPLEGHAISSILIENSYGDYVVCGGGFAPTEYEDYKLKGITCRYYQAYDGKIELRLWGIVDSVKITVFYDDETPRRGVALPEDLETYDLGQYKEGFDNMEVVGQRDLVEDVEVTEEKAGLSPVVIGVGAGVGALAVAGGVVAVILKRRKKAGSAK